LAGNLKRPLLRGSSREREHALSDCKSSREDSASTARERGVARLVLRSFALHPVAGLLV
jgi:hypothetical protein